MKISKLIRKALEYDNNGDPLSDVISGDAEWADVLEYTVSLEERIQQLKKWRQNDCRIIDAQRQRIQQLTEALEMIAGKRPCTDMLMGNVDIAIAALPPKENDRG